jgi:repressor LexA
MSDKLTEKQAQLLQFLEKQHDTGDGMPTLQEISDHFGFSSLNSARQHLRLIAKKGYIKLSPHRSRSIQLIRRLTSPSDAFTKDMVRVPLVGRIPAGDPVSAIDELEATLALPREFFKGERLFALRVEGDSMIGAGIFHNDLAVLNAQSDFRDGEIAAVVVNEEATLKRIYHTKDGFRLHAENIAYPDRVVRPSSRLPVRIAGILRGTFRRF